ncbi:site-specific integrase [Mesorhizobium microcysteis]|uniref:Site-specific integrase n=1 Tax=Neoaquamicrobium microcysteis TaxID=2682781 RepID=A0A5D4H4I3_9HYPH|nr:site-specific integrase [Mesorhizobium microcysteis]TYR33700.1 site-specific integrase [Mesorhizobium microcysteis]
MASIRKHRDKYQVRIRRHGYPTITKTFAKLPDAKEWANHQERQADRGELGPDKRELDRITLADLIKRYLKEVVPRKRHGETDTFALNMLLRHKVAKKSLSELSPSDFTSYRDERLTRPCGRRGKTVSLATLKRQLTPVRHMFRHAHDDWGIPLRDNPLAKVRFKGADKRRERRLREGEQDRLLLAGKKTRNPLIVPIIRFALETAMRRGEILALRFHDVDLERHSLTVRESKNGYSRTIPLSAAAVAVLTDAIRRMSDKDKVRNALIFPTKPLALRLAWDRLTKRAGIDDLNFHDLRHEAISRLFELGLTVPEVASVSGHRDMRMLFRYAHANHVSIRAKLNMAEGLSG